MAFRVLIVDDERDVVELLAVTLECAGYEIIRATTFEEGKRLLLDTPPPDVLITDVRLGQFNGLHLVICRAPTTGAVVVSGYSDRTLAEEARRHGGVYLLKPVPAEELLESVKLALERRGAPPEPPSQSTQ